MAERVVVVGAGMGGLSAALDLVRQGCDVTVLERQAAPGGKMRRVGMAGIDAGPTVFTMRWVFEELFGDAGATLAEHVDLTPAATLARHAWGDQRLDLFADIDRSADAIGAFCGEAAGYRAFVAEARRIYRTLEKPFLRSPRPTAMSLALGAGIGPMLGVRPFDTMATALRSHFRAPRLRQLFGRYATYCGSSPYRAPATLMLVAHVEQDGVWLIEGGMARLAAATAALAASQGARFRYGVDVAEILVAAGRAAGVRLTTGERIAADRIVWNGDPNALAAGLAGRAAREAGPGTRVADRSLSAITWAMSAEISGFPLLHHTVFFSEHYPAEFRDLEAGRIPAAGTAYICAQDRADTDEAPPAGPERLLLLINAPPHGDRRPFPETAACLETTKRLLARSGLVLEPRETITTDPPAWERLFPATGGALYGPAVHGSMSTFRRPGARTKLPGLYLAGGATHPGAGVPMAALSGRVAAAAILQDRGSMRRSRPVAMPGGMSMR